MKIDTEHYQEMCDSYMGYCPDCQDFTCPNTEPDAYGYLCPECGEMEVMGTEQALLDGLIELTG